jgi:hypothetical protein
MTSYLILWGLTSKGQGTSVGAGQLHDLVMPKEEEAGGGGGGGEKKKKKKKKLF